MWILHVLLNRKMSPLALKISHMRRIRLSSKVFWYRIFIVSGFEKRMAIILYSSLSNPRSVNRQARCAHLCYVEFNRFAISAHARPQRFPMIDQIEHVFIKAYSSRIFFLASKYLPEYMLLYIYICLIM
jgi:hypothetical protein